MKWVMLFGGFPDTYDYDGSSFGTGFYSVMSGNQVGGEVEPIGGPFFMKAGWASVVDIEPNTSYTLPIDGKLVARYRNPDDSNEYFILEACKQATPGNAAFPVERGIVIWHIDENVTTTNTLENMTLEAHYAYSIEQADGLFELENGSNQGNAGDIFVEGIEFDSSTLPNSNWWNGTNSGLAIHSIQFNEDNTISFCNGACNLAIPVGKNQVLSNAIYQAASQTILIKYQHSTLVSSNQTMLISDALGKPIYKKRIENNSSMEWTINMAGRAKGLYFVSLTDETDRILASKKIMVY
jgi:hypothetical protein